MDFTKLCNVFDELGIKYEIGRGKEHYILLGEGEGYTDFWCKFDFDENGKFESHRVCEG